MSLVRALLALAGGGLAGLLVGGFLGWLLGEAYLRWWAPPDAEPAGTGMAAFLIMSLVAMLGALIGAIAGLMYYLRAHPA